MNRILALLSASQAREELGLGAIRDGMADHLFPGTSTIQTRLRYFLFAPWIYADLEQRQVRSGDFGRELRRAEQKLISALRLNDDQVGVFGRRAGGELKRLPSAVYWSGLGAWGLRLAQYPQQDYHRQLDQLYHERRGARGRESSAEQEDDGLACWHRHLPTPPDGFPADVELALRPEEARFLIDQVQSHHPGSLLAYLFLQASGDPPPVAGQIWEHPSLASFSADAQERLEHCRLLSQVMQGAALLYNRMLAERAEREELAEDYADILVEWADQLDRPALLQWNLDCFWDFAEHPAHTISLATRSFVTEWHRLALLGEVDASRSARVLVKQREMRLKRGRSRFTNQRALEEWGGHSGIDPMNYRWPVVRQFLTDLHTALGTAP